MINARLVALTLLWTACTDPAPPPTRRRAAPAPSHHGTAPSDTRDLPAPTDRPLPAAGAHDVLIVTVDTLRADTIDHPSMQALAARGRRFTQATTPLPRTTPALASMLSGRTPQHHGSEEVGQPVSSPPALAAAFRDAGWHTMGFSGTPVAGPDQGLDAGFEHFEVWADPRATDLVAAAVAAIPHDDRPVLLWVHLTDPHFPYLPRHGPAAARCRELGELARDRKLSRSWIFGDFDGRASAALSDCRLLYDTEVAAVDEAIPALWEALHDPWIVFSSDHGENMGEEGLYYEHGPSLHDAALRIPLVLAGPGISPAVDDGVATLQDIAPTLLSLAGLPPLPDADGVDLLGSDRPVAAAAISGSALQERLHTFLRSGRATGRNCVNIAPWSWCTDGLFDHVTDPEQHHDLSGDHPDVVAHMQTVAARWPAEQARERAVRTPRFKLRTRPTADGEQRRLYRLPDEEHPVDAPTVQQSLESLLPPLPGAGAMHGSAGDADRDDGEEALRALGYVE